MTCFRGEAPSAQAIASGLPTTFPEYIVNRHVKAIWSFQDFKIDEEPLEHIDRKM